MRKGWEVRVNPVFTQKDPDAVGQNPPSVEVIDEHMGSRGAATKAASEEDLERTEPRVAAARHGLQIGRVEDGRGG